MRVAVYMRCGNKEQIGEEAIQMQEAALSCFAQSKGYEVVGKYHDLDTGWTLDRQGLHSMLKDAADGKFEKIIATGYSRLAIGTGPLLKLTEQLNAAGVSAETIHDPPLPTKELSCLRKALYQSKFDRNR